MALSWLHCNNCYLNAAAVQNTAKREIFALAICGHIFCSTCREKCASARMCTVCGRSPFVYENVGLHMSEKTKNYFQTPNGLLMNALKRINSVIKFQQNQYCIMQKNLNRMNEGMNDIAYRCKETAKICDVLKRDANSLMSNMQHHHGMLQRLNNSIAECTQNWELFGDARENTNTTGSLRCHSSQDKNGKLTETDSFLLRKGPFDFALLPSEVVKESRNLATVFGSKDESNKMNLSQFTNNSNLYMQYLSQKNAHSSVSICSATAPIKKDGLDSQQLGSKRRPKVLRNIHLPQDAFKMESGMHGLFNARAHSLSHSPPLKSSRPDDSSNAFLI